MTTAIIGYGSTFSVETAPGSGSYTALGEVTDITPPNNQIDQIEATHMASPGRVKEFIPGLTDLGDMTVAMNYVPSNATDTFLLAWRADGTTRACKITYPNAHTDVFQGFLKGYAPTLQTAAKASATLTVRVAGAVTRV
ncbi:phage tail tube protein [Phenylobacterium sp.]|jgi:hypothetical protein|uniref:phage tail tube protein n=1 Tax=Phenylobacterium sp. TaxID=1871053 RepID=UPI002F420DA3